MNKILLVFILTISFSSCQTIPYAQIPIIIKTAVIGADDIVISDQVIESREFSFIKVKIGKDFIAILSLVSINDGVFDWISSTGEHIYTFNGKVIKTTGLPHNIHVYSYKSFYCELSNQRLINYDLMLDNPKAFISQAAEISYNSPIPKKCTEKIITNGFSWSSKNFYTYSANNLPLQTTQSIHPKLPIIQIDFFYKYK
jgi:hypothetical protein